MTPLNNVIVLDLSRILAGPNAATIMAEMGARVIKVEQPGGDPGRSHGPIVAGISIPSLAYNRSKKSITLDLKQEEDRKALYDLVRTADILIHNYTPKLTEKLGLAYETLKSFNPKLIVIASTGYGHDSPNAERLVYDPIIQAETGLMSITGDPDGKPQRIGYHAVDYLSSLWIVVAALSAYISGKGTFVDYSMFDGQMSVLNLTATIHWVTGEVSTRQGNRYSHFQLSANFDTKDNRQVHIVAVSIPHWKSLCSILDVSEWGEQYLSMESRHNNRESIIQTINTLTVQFSSTDLLTFLRQENIPAGLVATLDEALNSEQIKARKQINELEYEGLGKMKYISLPFKMQGLTLPMATPCPKPGQHTGEVLGEPTSLR